MADNQTEKQKVQELTDRLERHNRGIIGHRKMLRKKLQKYMKNHRKMLQEASGNGSCDTGGTVEV